MSRRENDIGPPYMVFYWHKGIQCAFKLPADDWDEAQDRIRSIGATGEVVGSGVESYHADALTLPWIALRVRLSVWWRNRKLQRRRAREDGGE